MVSPSLLPALVSIRLLPPGVDGVLLISVFSDRYLAEILKLGLPVVGLDCPVNADWGKGLDVVISEGRESVRSHRLHRLSHPAYDPDHPDTAPHPAQYNSAIPCASWR